MSNRLKISIVGDGMVGKTCLLLAYTQNEFPKEYNPTVFDNYVVNISVDCNEYELVLWDTAGQEDYDKMRLLSYPNTSCVLLCYAIDSKTSYVNVKSKWYPELKHYTKNAPIILIGTKSDLRTANSTKYVSTAEGLRRQKEIRAYSFVECSAMKMENLSVIFDEAVRAVSNKHKSKVKRCILL